MHSSLSMLRRRVLLRDRLPSSCSAGMSVCDFVSIGPAQASDGSAEESAGESEVAPRARAAPRAAAARKPVIVDLSSEEEAASAAEEDSDFEGDSE